MRSLFDKELTEMEREVRDLKTIHQRGLGTTRFYTYEQDIDIPSGGVFHEFSLFATFEDASLVPAVVLPYVGGPTISNFSIQFSDDGFVVSSLASEGTVSIYIVTTAAISSIRTEVRDF